MSGVAGRSGRKPKPTNLILLEGGKVRRANAKTEQQPPSTKEMPRPPKHFYSAKEAPAEARQYLDDARHYWQSKARVLYPLGLLTLADLTAFEMCCRAYADWRGACRQRDKGYYVRDPDKAPRNPKGKWGSMVNPFYVIERNEFKKLSRMETEFGMTPSSRARVQATPPAPPANSPDGWGDLLPLN